MNLEILIIKKIYYNKLSWKIDEKLNKFNH